MLLRDAKHNSGSAGKCDLEELPIVVVVVVAVVVVVVVVAVVGVVVVVVVEAVVVILRPCPCYSQKKPNDTSSARLNLR